MPSEWLTRSVLDNSGIIGYNHPARSEKALRACRVRYARKSSFVFVRSSCLWFLPQSAVEKSRSQRVGKWEIPEPTATVGCRPQAGRWRRVPQHLGSSTWRLQNRRNKARMFMKTKGKHKKSLNRTVPDQTPTARPQGRRSDGDGRLSEFLTPPHVVRKIEGTKPECI